MIVALVFLAFSGVGIVSALKKGNEGFAYHDNWCLVNNIIGYSFLLQVIVMTSLVVWLFIET